MEVEATREALLQLDAEQAAQITLLIQEEIKHFRDGALERFAAIFADCIPWKTRAQLNRNPF